MARFRGVKLEPIAGHIVGHGEVGQATWAAWRRKEQLEGSCEEELDDQMKLVAEVVDPVFAQGPG